MSNTDITKLSRKQFIKFLEEERLEMFSVGMNEADIFRIHFGEPDEGGRGGDYRIWLDERKHIRDDHKYASGTVFVIDVVDSDGTWIKNINDCIDEIEFYFDLEIAFSTLTDIQRKSFIEVRLSGRTQADLACELGVSRENVKQAIEGALKKLKKYFC